MSRLYEALQKAESERKPDHGGSLRGYNVAPTFRGSESRHVSLFEEYIHTIKSRIWMISLCALAGGFAAILFSLSALPLYKARTSLEIQKINGDFMNMRAVAPTGGGVSGDEDVQTQIKLLQSDALRDRVVEKLTDENHPAIIERQDLLSELKRRMHIAHSESLPYGDLISETAKSVVVKPLGVTRLIEITCDSWSAEFAAKFCNAMVREYREADQETRSSEALKTSEWLTRQVADVKLKAEDSQRRLEEATGGNGLVLGQQSDSVGEDRLRQIQGELVRAQADRMEKEAQLGLLSTSTTDTLPKVLDSPTFRSYEQKLAELQTAVAQLVPPLTEENPKVIHLRSQIREVEAGMVRERTTGSGRVRDEYEASKHREALLAATYKAAETGVSSDLGKASKVSLLRREVDSEQQLYQTLLQRAREAGFASALQTTTVRTVDSARMPKASFSPKRGTSACIGIFLGAIFGIAFSFLKERRLEVFRLPGEIQKRLHVMELGVIPSSEMGRKNVIVSTIQTIRGSKSTSNGILDVQGPIGFTRWNTNDFSIAAEAYRTATFSILRAEPPRGRARIYVVSSPNAGEGKTTVSSNLGVALSKSKLRVLLVDGDLRKPALHTALHLENTVGLRNILRGEMDVRRAPLERFCKATSMPNLSVLMSGTGREEVVELLHSPDILILLDRLSHEFDVVLIDTPPMLQMTDARILASHTDGAILVFRAGVTTYDQAGDAIDILARDQVPLIGTILNDFDPFREGKPDYYSSYYLYKGGVDAAQEAAADR